MENTKRPAFLMNQGSSSSNFAEIIQWSQEMKASLSTKTLREKKIESSANELSISPNRIAKQISPLERVPDQEIESWDLSVLEDPTHQISDLFGEDNLRNPESFTKMSEDYENLENLEDPQRSDVFWEIDDIFDERRNGEY